MIPYSTSAERLVSGVWVAGCTRDPTARRDWATIPSCLRRGVKRYIACCCLRAGVEKDGGHDQAESGPGQGGISRRYGRGRGGRTRKNEQITVRGGGTFEQAQHASSAMFPVSIVPQDPGCYLSPEACVHAQWLQAAERKSRPHSSDMIIVAGTYAM